MNNNILFCPPSRNNYINIDEDQIEKKNRKLCYAFLVVTILVTIVASGSWSTNQKITNEIEKIIMKETGDFRDVRLPYSNVNPEDVGINVIFRSEVERPPKIFGKLREIPGVSFPTNSWIMNLIIGTGNRTGEANRVFQLPYVIEAASFMQGLRVHPVRVTANDRTVMMVYEADSGMTIGAVDQFSPHEIVSDAPGSSVDIGRLSVILKWTSPPSSSSSQAIEGEDGGGESSMYSPLVRGSPYVSMVYTNAAPRIFVQRAPAGPLLVDSDEDSDSGSSLGRVLECGRGWGNHSLAPVLVRREVRLALAVADDEWLILLSRPTLLTCAASDHSAAGSEGERDPPGVVRPRKDGWQTREPFIEIRAVERETGLMIRIIHTGNCTTGRYNSPHCDLPNKKKDSSEMVRIARKHKDLYASGRADIRFVMPPQPLPEDLLALQFAWRPSRMSRVHLLRRGQFADDEAGAEEKEAEKEGEEEVELLMYALPHHQERLEPVAGSSNRVVPNVGCAPTLHGPACLAIGSLWSLREHLHKVSFWGDREVRPEMRDDLLRAIDKDLEYRLPDNYLHGAGDTYFSGKMLSRLARVLSLSAHLSRTSPLGAHLPRNTTRARRQRAALAHLQQAAAVWFEAPLFAHSPLFKQVRAQLSAQAGALTGELSAEYGDFGDSGDFRAGDNGDSKLSAGDDVEGAGSPLLYDRSWGGMVMCGCEYDGQSSSCFNKFPNCPALVDQGQNFGAGFYNDHHFHFGYHIFAAAVVADLDPAWGARHFERVLLLIRDIANPSSDDHFFPAWRHKDWFLGFSWASGISISESIAAYEAVALYGLVMKKVFKDLKEKAEKEVGEEAERDRESFSAKESICERIHEMGRLLFATETRSAHMYYQVRASPSSTTSSTTSSQPRVYPEMYQGRVVGMLWSMLAQEQTWFGNEPYKSYGIQLMPITAGSELRDSPDWVAEMLPLFESSCEQNPGCARDGWSVLVECCRAVVGGWREAWLALQALPEEVFEAAGGNGHSRANTLWYIATRPPYPAQ